MKKFFLVSVVTFLLSIINGCSSAPARKAADVEEPLRIIDAHVHTAFTNMPVNKTMTDLPRKTEEEFFNEMKENNVIGAVSHTIDGGKIFYKDLQSRNVIHCVGIGEKFNVKQIREDVESGKFSCIKIYLGYIHKYAYDESYEPLYDIAQDNDIPVVFHTGDTVVADGKLKYADPLTIDEVAVDHPKVRLVIAHCGMPWIESAAEVAYKNANVYLDASAFMIGDLSKQPQEKIDNYVSRPMAWVFGYVDNPGKLMYGTDWPLTTMAPYIAAVKRAIPKQYWRAVFHDNAYKVFNFDRLKK